MMSLLVAADSHALIIVHITGTVALDLVLVVGPFWFAEECYPKILGGQVLHATDCARISMPCRVLLYLRTVLGASVECPRELRQEGLDIGVPSMLQQCRDLRLSECRGYVLVHPS